MAVFTAIGAGIFGAGTFLAGLTAAGLQVAAGVALSLIGKAIAGEPDAGRQRFGVQGRIQGGDAVPRSILFGHAATAGSYVWGNTWGSAGGVQNAYITQVIALADYPIRALTGFIANDIPSALGDTPHPTLGLPVLDYRRGGTDHMWVKFYDGTQTAADSFLVNTVASAARPWGTNRIGRGIPYAIVTCMAPVRSDGDPAPLFQNGLPRFKFVVEGSRLYDPSDPEQDYDDPDTWGGDGDFLPVVQVYNLLRGIRFNGEWLYGLQSLAATRLPVSAWVNEIEKCRATIEGPDGMEPTYRTGGEVQVGAQIRLAIEAMLTGCQGRLTETGGTYKPFVGEPNDPVISFTDGDILSTEEQTFTPFYGLEDTINGIQATYPNPSEGWNDKTAPPLIRTDLEALDGNRRLMANVSLDMVPYGGQVQRLMQSALREAQRARRHTITMGPEFWVLEPGDYVVWTSVRNGYVDKLFRVDGIADQPDLNVMLDLTEVDPSDYDWNQAEDFRPVLDGPLVLVDTPPLPAIGWQAYGVAILDELGRERRPGIEVAYEPGLQGVEHVRIQVRNIGAAEPFIDAIAAYGHPWRTQIAGDFPPNTTYEVRGIYVLSGSGTAEWSAWLEVTTPDVKLTAGLDFDPFEGVVGFDSLGDDLNQWTQQMGMSVRELIAAIQETANYAADQEQANSLQFQEVRHEMGVSLGEVQATFSQTITVAIIPLQNSVAALADWLTELSAGDGTDVSTARFRMTTLSGPTGYSRIGAETRVDSGSDWRGASWYLDTPANVLEPTRFVVHADQFVVANLDDTELQYPLVYDGTALRVNDLMVREASIFNGSITTAKIEDAAITTAKIEDLAVDEAKIDDLAVTNAKIGVAAVDTIQIAAGGVTTLYAVTNPSSHTIVAGFNQRGVLSLNITEGAVLLQGALSIGMSGGVGGQSVFAILRRNGVDVATQYVQGVGGDHPVSLFYIDENPGGNVTYQLGVAPGTVAPGGAGVYPGSALMAFNNKR